MKLNSIEKQALENAGYRAGAVTGGPSYKRYWKPCGCIVYAIPSERGFIRQENGEVVEQGTRDANYDKGWLPMPPEKEKLCCPYCDEWHDTIEGIEKCKDDKAELVQKAYAAATAKYGTPVERTQIGDRVDKLEETVNKLAELMTQFMATQLPKG
jgi:uncharacterized Zn-finger protein